VFGLAWFDQPGVYLLVFGKIAFLNKEAAAFFGERGDFDTLNRAPPTVAAEIDVLGFDQPLVAEILEVVFEGTGFAVVKRLAEVRRADDAKAPGFAEELLLLRAQLQANDVAGGTRRTARVRRGNRAATLAGCFLRMLTALALDRRTAPARIGGTSVQRFQPMEDRVVGQLPHGRIRGAVTLAAPGLFLGDVESHASSPVLARFAGAGANSIEA
jgi:hypothetical protein